MEPDKKNRYVRAIIMTSSVNNNGDCFPKEELEKACTSFIGKPVTLNIDGPVIGKVIDSTYTPNVGMPSIVACIEITDTNVDINPKHDFFGYSLKADSVSCSECGKMFSNEMDKCEHVVTKGAHLLCRGITPNGLALHQGAIPADINVGIIEEGQA